MTMKHSTSSSPCGMHLGTARWLHPVLLRPFLQDTEVIFRDARPLRVLGEPDYNSLILVERFSCRALGNRTSIRSVSLPNEATARRLVNRIAVLPPWGLPPVGAVEVVAVDGVLAGVVVPVLSRGLREVVRCARGSPSRVLVSSACATAPCAAPAARLGDQWKPSHAKAIRLDHNNRALA